MRRLLWLSMALLGACGPGDDVPDTDETAAAELEASTVSVSSSSAVFGSSELGRRLVVQRLVPSDASGKKALLVFAVHGFEDAWDHDGQALADLGAKVVAYYRAHPGRLHGWSLSVVAGANPDGIATGRNNAREGEPGAFGRCTAAGRDLNRNFASASFTEHDALKRLFLDEKPTAVVDFHGWYDEVLGDGRIGGFFADAFNARYAGKPSRYCLVPTRGAMRCDASSGGIFHRHPTIKAGLFAEWVKSKHGVPSALVEYPAPDFDEDGHYDTWFDAALGYRRMKGATLELLLGRTTAALNAWFKA